MKRLSDQTLYEILEIPEDAPPSAIQAAWQRAHDIYGPGSLATYTLMSPDEAALLARRIEEARATLLDPGARARYDEELRQPEPPRPAPSPPPHVTPLPPVIPALHVPPRPAAPPEDEGAEEEEDVAPDAEPPPEPPAARAEPPLARPAILLSAAVADDEPPVEATPAPPKPAREVPRPILLDREVPPTPPSLPARPVEPAPAAAPPLPVVPDGAWTGDALRQVREARGLSIPQIAERTKVTRHHIENIEGERFAALPAQVYLRGILLSLARELRLDGQKVARAYLDRVAGAASAKPK